MGFASRVPVKEFLSRYRKLAPKPLQQQIAARKTADEEQACIKEFLEMLPDILGTAGEPGNMVLGISKVFAKAEAMAALERNRDLALAGYASDIQRLYRGHQVRRKHGGAKRVFSDLLAWKTKNNYYTAPGSRHTALAKLGTMQKIEAEVAEVNRLMEEAQKLSLDMPLLRDTEKVRARMSREAAALKTLQEVAASVEPTEIERSLARARELELEGAGEAVDALVVRVRRLKAQIPLVKAMKDSMQKEDLAQLQEVMEKVKAAGLHQRPEDWVPELGGEATAASVYQMLTDLKAKQKMEDIEKKRKEELQQQVEASRPKEEQFQESEVAPAPSRKKTRRVTITGLTEAAQEDVERDLLAAVEVFNAAALEQGLQQVNLHGMELNETLKTAQETFMNLQSEAFLETTMRAQTEALGVKGQQEVKALRCLQNLVSQAERLGVASEARVEARQKMQAGVRNRARSTIRGSIFQHLDLEELDLVEGAFSNLSAFPRMKDVNQWRGHCGPGLFGWGGDGNKEAMLKHCRNEIREALTTVPAPLDREAVQNFRNILGWMGDRPLPESQRLGYAQDIVQVAQVNGALADETFVQVMKQLAQNPSPHSELLGWKLMLLLCQRVRPSHGLEDFLRTALLRAVRHDNGEVAALAKQCISDLNVLAAPEKAATGEENVAPIEVMLIDRSIRKVHVSQDATLKQLSERLSKQLRITSAQDFGLFQVTEGLEMHRLLPDETVLSVLLPKWRQLHTNTGRASQLLYKRRFLRVDESLRPGELMHATLTFQQAVWDYLRYPLPEDPEAIAKIAASIIMAEGDRFIPIVQAGRLYDPGVLEQLVPATSLGLQNRGKWGAQLARHHTVLRRRTDNGEPRLAKMSRVLSLLQRMKLFGSYYWVGTQVANLPADKAAIPEAPARMLKLNQREPEGEYWICVDLFGVRFISINSTPDCGFSRGFLFNEEAVERVLCWGGKQNVVQFVVSSFNTQQPAAGRVPMTVALHCPAAVDVAYTVHTVQRMLQP